MPAPSLTVIATGSPTASAPSPRPVIVSWIPSARSWLASSAGVIAVPGAGATSAQPGGAVSTTAVTVGDASVAPCSLQVARNPTVPSATVTGTRTVPSAAIPVAIDRSGPPCSNTSTAKPGRVVTTTVVW